MKIEQIKEVANAVLYESYLLYPYRQSAIKNRQRWTIGIVYPREYSEINGGVEPWSMQTECLGMGDEGTTFDLYVRFLHVLMCTVKPSAESAAARAQSQSSTDDGFERSLVGRFIEEPREEGAERELCLSGLSLRNLTEHAHVLDFDFPGERLVEEATDALSETLIREQQALRGTVTVAAKRIGTDSFKLTVRIENHTPETGAITSLHDIMAHSFVSTHTILQVHQGSFVSSIDPPEAVSGAAQECKNVRTWPVLVGDEGDTDSMLSSPIILYDYPQIAPESPGTLFDGTEIDEILTLRIMTLTDEEKNEMRQGDRRVREILERTESLTPEAFMKLHGTIRSMKPVDEESTEF